MRIKKENSLFAYFEIIEKLEPASILDVGMFLKRTGSVSRQVMNSGVPEKVWLDGIDIFPEISFAAWKNIYNRIFTWQEFLPEISKNEYDLAVIFGSDAIKKHFNINELFLKIESSCRYFLFDSLSEVDVESIANRKGQKVIVGGEVYYFIDNSQ